MITRPTSLFAGTVSNTTADAPAPGVYEGVPLETYLGWGVLSRSSLVAGRDSMAHLHAAVTGESTKKATDDMVLGSGLHTAVLEPETAAERIAVWADGTRRGKEWDAFKADHAGRIILTSTQYGHLQGMVRSLRRHPEARRWMGMVERTELSAVGLVNGVMMKARTDGLTSKADDVIVDLKKVAAGDERSMRAAVMGYGYDVQSYVYRKLFGRERFVLITVEDAPPYDVVPYEFSPVLLKLGETEACRLLDQVKFCTERGHWPGRSDVTVPLDPPDWALPEDGIDWSGLAPAKE